jgi:hypothetical protein
MSLSSTNSRISWSHSGSLNICIILILSEENRGYSLLFLLVVILAEKENIVSSYQRV